MTETLSQIDPKKNIIIKGARLHNLKNVNVVIPRNKLVVITGLSGSGKSTLAYDTLYAEGQRRYVESLSSYARQFLGRLDKPKVDYIKGISPAIAIQQKVNSTNPRSTVGTSTEIYEYLRLLFARIGKTISPISGHEVRRNTVSDVTDYIKTFPERTKLLLLAPISIEKGRTPQEKIEILAKQGYSRIKIDKEVVRIDEADLTKLGRKKLMLVVDRIITKDDEDFYNRLADAVQEAFYEGKGEVFLEKMEDGSQRHFSNKFELDGMEFLEPNQHLFSFNNPYGACPNCEGYGDVIGLDEELIFPNTGLSVYEEVVAPWRGKSMSKHNKKLIDNAYKFDFPVHKPYFELTEEQKELLWTGNKYFKGLNSFFDRLEKKAYKIQNRVMLSRYRGKTKCQVCKGKRLRKEAGYVKVGGQSILELIDLPLDKTRAFFADLKLDEYDAQVAKRLLKEINSRLEFLSDVGLDYLTINRKSNSLSGGESQRINIATSLGSSLVGSMYILDEPSIGLHARDNERLIKVLIELRDLGNTIIVVEHDEDIMKIADEIIDVGPEAGTLGGEIVATGSYDQILKSSSLTAKYLKGELEIAVPKKRRSFKNYVDIIGARENNLKNIDVRVPLGIFTVITGVSGSGKSTLVRKILYPGLQKELFGQGAKAGQFTELKGEFKNLKNIEYVDQNPIGRSSRSNPVTYIKAYDDIRKLFANQKLAKLRKFKPKHFSFNVDGGRCEKCKGEGEVTIEMQFMADVHLECETCKGRRFKKEVLEVKFHDKSIFDVLSMTIDDAIAFFEKHEEEKIQKQLKPLQEVGLGYVTLGQSSSTLSGGEAQRVKLASFLGKGQTKNKTLFIFDEPTTGLHFHDIKKLLKSFDALIKKGHSVLVIEHNIELIKCADYIIDLGPEGGEKGGYVVVSGTPEEIVKHKTSYTAKYLKPKL